MSDRTIRRRIARQLYDKFSKVWRRDARLSGRYGKIGSRKPRFGDWWKMHLAQISQMKESTPEDVREYLQDPWIDPGSDVDAPSEHLANTDAGSVDQQRRGVVTIPIAVDDE